MSTIQTHVPAGLTLRRHLEVSEADFSQPVASPFGDRVSVDDPLVRAWCNDPQGILFTAQHVQQRIEKEGPQRHEAPNGDDFVGPGGQGHAGMRVQEQGIISQGPDTLFFSQGASGHGGAYRADHRFEIRHQADRGTVTILEYSQPPTV